MLSLYKNGYTEEDFEQLRKICKEVEKILPCEKSCEDCPHKAVCSDFVRLEKFIKSL